MTQRVAYSLIFLIVLLNSCTNEPAVEVDNLYGDWEIIAAKRNLKLTSTLRDGYFKFTEDGQMKTNIYGNDQVFNILVSSDEIVQQDGEKTVYKIRKLEKDTLHISSNIQKYYFDFLAVKRDSVMPLLSK